MKNFFNARIVRLLGIISLALVIGFSIAACKSGDDGDDGPPKVPGTIAITPTSGAPGTTLTATWTPATPKAGETAPTVKLQWKKDGQVLGSLITPTGNPFTCTVPADAAGKYKITVISDDSNAKKYGNRDSNTVTIKAQGSNSGGGGTSGILTFTNVPDDVLAVATGDSPYFWKSGVLAATTLPTDADDWYEQRTGDTVAEIDDSKVTIKSTGKSTLTAYMTMNRYTGSGPHVVYIQNDNSGDKCWIAVVTFTNGCGTFDYTTAINENTL